MTVAKELFIVEGESTASALHHAMHKSTQDVLAVQGKLLNAKKASPARVFANQASYNNARNKDVPVMLEAPEILT